MHIHSRMVLRVEVCMISEFSLMLLLSTESLSILVLSQSEISDVSEVDEVSLSRIDEQLMHLYNCALQ